MAGAHLVGDVVEGDDYLIGGDAVFLELGGHIGNEPQVPSRLRIKGGEQGTGFRLAGGETAGDRIGLRIETQAMFVDQGPQGRLGVPLPDFGQGASQDVMGRRIHALDFPRTAEIDHPFLHGFKQGPVLFFRLAQAIALLLVWRVHGCSSSPDRPVRSATGGRPMP